MTIRFSRVLQKKNERSGDSHSSLHRWDGYNRGGGVPTIRKAHAAHRSSAGFEARATVPLKTGFVFSSACLYFLAIADDVHLVG